MTSLKSSVGSKSSSFHPAASGGGDGDGRSTALGSSWICRLRLGNVPPPFSGHEIRSPAASPGDAALGKRTVSTNESRTPSPSVALRFREIVPRKPPQTPGGDVDRLLVASFGPFRVRTMGNVGGFRQPCVRRFGKVSLGEDNHSRFRRTTYLGDKGDAGIPIDGITGPRPSPFSLLFRSQLSADDMAADQEVLGANRRRNGRYLDADPTSSSRLNSYLGHRGGENKLQISDTWPAFGPWSGTSSAQHEARSRGSAYDASASRTFQPAAYNWDAEGTAQKPATAVGRHESEEPFSFWNMGSLKRSNFVVSSLSPTSNLVAGKRKPSTDHVVACKYRRVGRKD